MQQLQLTAVNRTYLSYHSLSTAVHLVLSPPCPIMHRKHSYVCGTELYRFNITLKTGEMKVSQKVCSHSKRSMEDLN